MNLHMKITMMPKKLEVMFLKRGNISWALKLLDLCSKSY